MKPIYICILFLSITILGWAGTNHSYASYYCRNCGMKKGHDQREWFRFSYQNTNHIYQTGYSELYFRVAPSCKHQWIFIGGQSSGSIFHGGLIACGAFPHGLSYAPLLRRLRNMDKMKIPTVLAAMPLQPFVSEPSRERMDNIIDSLIDVDENATRQETEEWWQKNQKLFEH